MFKVFPADSVHRNKHTFLGWATWIAIVFGGWVISFVIGEAVPFFNDLLSLISSLFDSWFGFIFWGAAWFELNKGRRTKGPLQVVNFALAVIMIVAGLFFFGAGTYAAVQSIVDSYHTGALKAPFRCTNTGFTFDR